MDTSQIIWIIVTIALFVLVNLAWIAWSWLLLLGAKAYWLANGRLPRIINGRFDYFPLNKTESVADEASRNYLPQKLVAIFFAIFGSLGIFTYITQMLPKTIEASIRLFQQSP